MRKNKFFIFAVASLAGVVLLPACNVKVRKEANGQDKQVDINTLVGGIHVSKQADVADTGLAVYPGARLKQKDSDGSDKTTNVNISGFGFGLKVIALEYESDDDPAEVLAFYKDQLKKYGSVLECRNVEHMNLDTDFNTHGSDGGSHELTCRGESGHDTELKVGKKDDQHIVQVKQEGKGSSFALVYVRTHGKDADI